MSLKTLRRYLLITAGCAVYALAFNWCYAPNNIAYGGFTGVAQIIHAFLGFPSIGALVFCMNVPLFLLGWKLLGGRLLVSSLYAMTLSSLFIDLLDRAYAFRPMEPLLACIYGGLLLGISLGVILGQGASTGGTDLLARLLKLPLPWLPMGKLLLGLDLAVICVYALVFHSLDTALYGLIALYISTLVMDTVLYGLDTAKVAYIITDQTEAVLGALVHQLERGVTILHGQGGWSGEEKQILMCAFKQRQIVAVKQAVKELDPDAFLIVCDAHEVLGLGFRHYQQHDI
ncbi:YitT family protein [Pseudoflavonifractor phocaeensis]|uniref:YitT family protein n=1 Tax=Pseudoflavonifractor phocaeensis TaxID=1870988 RepID=UPI001F4835A7|nr:YitT family protein [Pseudoflavonifractor phocaeensis]